MVVHSDVQQRADEVFHALADPTRRDILRRCLRSEHSISMIAARYPMSFAAVQKHVAVLERSKLVTKQRRGREQWVRGDPPTIAFALHLLEQLEAEWRDRLERFDEILTTS